MKKIILLLTALLVPAVTMAGIRNEPKCYIGVIEPSYAVTETRVTYKASVFIKDEAGKPVPDTLVEGIWRGKKKDQLVPSKCTTKENGKCTLTNVVRLGEKPEEIPQRGVRVTGVECPKKKYIYVDNTNFAWVFLK